MKKLIFAWLSKTTSNKPIYTVYLNSFRDGFIFGVVASVFCILFMSLFAILIF